MLTTRTYFRSLTLASHVARAMNEQDITAIVVPDAWPPGRETGADVYAENAGCVQCYEPSYGLTLYGPICEHCAANAEGVFPTRHVTRAPQGGSRAV